MILGDLGADVIRIDRPADAGKASDYPILHRNRRSVALDLKSPRDRSADARGGCR
jgi:alpha-methylacyl-CoA racemase